MGKNYFIEIDGDTIPVSVEIYRAFKRPAWRERKRAKVRSERELSLDAFSNSGYDIPSDEPLLEEIVADKLLLDQLFAALAELTSDERTLIDELFYNEKSEREVGAALGVSQNTVNYRKNRTLEKLRKILQKFF